MEKYRHYKRTSKWGRFVRHMRKTWVNKVFVLVMLALGGIACKMSNDATVFVFLLVFFGPAFFMDEPVFY